MSAANPALANVGDTSWKAIVSLIAGDVITQILIAFEKVYLAIAPVDGRINAFGKPGCRKPCPVIANLRRISRIDPICCYIVACILGALEKENLAIWPFN